jgi:DNA-binding XRE family transcriptional regulator
MSQKGSFSLKDGSKTTLYDIFLQKKETRGRLRICKRRNNMELGEFIRSSGLKIIHVADKVGASRNHMSCIIKKNRKPSWRLARDISEFTQGLVSIEEILGGFEDNKKEA